MKGPDLKPGSRALVQALLDVHRHSLERLLQLVARSPGELVAAVVMRGSAIDLHPPRALSTGHA